MMGDFVTPRGPQARAQGISTPDGARGYDDAMSYPPQHQPPPYIVQMQRPPSNGQAVAAMVLGIIAAAVGVWAFIPVLGLISAILGFTPALIAVILGHLGLKTADRMGGTGRSQATTGVVLGYVTLGIIAVTTLFWMVSIGMNSNT